MSVLKVQGMYPEFTRKGGPHLKASHYCAGCGHGIIHKLISEALAEMELLDKAVIISPVGCTVFSYYYFDAANIQAAHGRAAAVATAIARTRPDSVVISYQGDGDLASIGLNQTLQAANRGERCVIFFVNNATYGMTGGQLAPTSLVGQKTLTSPHGRDPLDTGYPLHMCELINQLRAPVYIERVSVADASRVLKAKKAVRKALELQRDRKGFAFVEFLSPCPTNLRMDGVAAAEYTTAQMEKEFPLDCWRDNSAAAVPHGYRTAEFNTPADLFGKSSNQPAEPDATFQTRRLKFSGYGGQGILRLGVTVADAAVAEKRFVSWFPTYGPEQRGGAASCAVVVSGQPVGSPVVDAIDLFVAMNQFSLERFAKDVVPGGHILYDASIQRLPEFPAGVQSRSLPAMELADQMGAPMAANTAMLAGLAAMNVTGLPANALRQAILDCFAAKPKVARKNVEVFDAVTAWCQTNWR